MCFPKNSDLFERKHPKKKNKYPPNLIFVGFQTGVATWYFMIFPKKKSEGSVRWAPALQMEVLHLWMAKINGFSWGCFPPTYRGPHVIPFATDWGPPCSYWLAPCEIPKLFDPEPQLQSKPQGPPTSPLFGTTPNCLTRTQINSFGDWLSHIFVEGIKIGLNLIKRYGDIELIRFP